MALRVLFLLFVDINIVLSINQEIYIAYLGGTKEFGAQSLTESHHEILSRATGSVESARNAIIHSYKHSFSGFSARLTKKQADLLSKSSKVLSIYPSKTYHLQTTRSWDFLGLTQATSGLGKELATGAYDVIVGLLDTGIWPESRSFRDDNMPPVPNRWKGECVNPPGTNSSFIINCNRKIIGAKFYDSRKGSRTYGNARDDVGHGTHTASIATGKLLKNVSALGLAAGDARGGMPFARLAIYKVCWGISCDESDVLAGYDNAVNDGVDIISMSIGGTPVKYNVDGLAIGAYHAVERGVAVVAGAGNFDIFVTGVINGAPWMFTVGASTIDRSINKVQNNETDNFKPAPVMGGFSLGGPNVVDPNIIKPDVTAPGVDILAAWPSNIPVPVPGRDAVYSDYALLSGTSMSTPHAGGALALLKSVHPSWSPAALKSALMTTATVLDNTNHTITTLLGKPATAFSYGSGQIQPAKALDPGLVYDIEPADYISYLCGINYTSEQVRNITGDNSTECSTYSNGFSLNYPSIALSQLVPGSKPVFTTRTLTNVGPTRSIYNVSVEEASDSRLTIDVEPKSLDFPSSGAKLPFTVAFTLASGQSNQSQSQSWIFSALTWSDGVHSVRSPVAVLAS